jgi:hypothetical protein
MPGCGSRRLDFGFLCQHFSPVFSSVINQLLDCHFDWIVSCPNINPIAEFNFTSYNRSKYHFTVNNLYLERLIWFETKFFTDWFWNQHSPRFVYAYNLFHHAIIQNLNSFSAPTPNSLFPKTRASCHTLNFGGET